MARLSGDEIWSSSTGETNGRFILLSSERCLACRELPEQLPEDSEIFECDGVLVNDEEPAKVCEAAPLVKKESEDRDSLLMVVMLGFSGSFPINSVILGDPRVNKSGVIIPDLKD